METVVLSMGTNLGDRALNMRLMTGEIRGISREPLTFSSLMETEPVGVTGQQWFFNRLCRGSYDGSPESLLDECRRSESRLGRTREEHWGARTADIDILLFGDRLIERPELRIPHAYMRSRRFCLMALDELAPGLVFPGTAMTMHDIYISMDSGAASQAIRVLEPPVTETV